MPKSRHWSRHSLDELHELYLGELAAELREENIDPFEVDATTITRRYRGLDYALREHHDMTVSEFLTRVCGVSQTENPWGERLENATPDTREALVRYLESLQNHTDLEDSTIQAHRTALGTFVQTYANEHGEADILEGVTGKRAQPDEVDRVIAVFERLDDRLIDSTLIRYSDTADTWYNRLKSRGQADFNPIEAVTDTFRWEIDGSDPQAMEEGGVRALYACADSREESLLVLALAAWGLRPNEVAALHARQLVLDEDDPHLAFEERKNGPGTVALLFGLEELAAHLDDLAVDDDWNGYVFPSSRSESGHISVDTVRNRFRRLADRAEVTVDGETPVPKMGRRWWYQTYAKARAEMLELLEEIAGDQGSTSASVVDENYLDDTPRRKLRRRVMRDALEGVFE